MIIKNLFIYENTKKLTELIQLRIETIEEMNNEKEHLIKIKESLNQKKEEMERRLQELQGIEFQLYYQMAVKGLNPNKAVEKVSFDFDLTPSAVWKNYYPKVKQWMENLK